MKPGSSTISSTPAVTSAETRIAAYEWQAIIGELGDYGCAVLTKLLSPEECRAIAALYPDESHFRSHILMARHGFGKGEYRCFKYPLPASGVSLPSPRSKVSQSCGGAIGPDRWRLMTTAVRSKIHSPYSAAHGL
jgi:hypothetical protein